MNSKRITSSIKGFVSYIYITIVTTILPFIVRTLIIHYIGMEYAGVGNLFSSILSIINMADLGIDSAILFYMHKPYANGNIIQIKRLLNIFRKFYLMVGSFIILFGIITIPFIHKFILNSQYPSDVNLEIIYSLYLLSFAIPYLFGSYKIVIFKVDQRAEFAYFFGGTAAAIMYIVQMVIIVFYRDFFIYSLAMLVAPIINIIFINICFYKKYTIYKSEGNIEKSFIPQFIKKVSAIGLSKIRTMSRNSFDSIIISSFAGLILLAQYQNYYLLISVVEMVIASVKNAIIPSWGNGVALESKESNYGVLKNYTFIIGGVSTVCASVLLNLYQPFIKLWVGSKYLLPYYTVVLFCFYAYIRSMASICETLREVTGIWWEGSYFYIIDVVVNICLDIVLVRKIGIAGAILASIITLLFINIPSDIYYIFKYYFKMQLKSYILILIKSFVCTFLVVFICYYACQKIVVLNLLGLLLKMLLSAIVSLLLYILLNLRNKELYSFLNIIKKFLKMI
ncbi:lipopolysaccharide biosynthesis protein [Butyrivibrio sp. NC3005]|uniref:lipopolysaccharide biosynthesis protein n=1 Tax=Butyrivibrio sp. NC3005 TaxID=1280685 RepID=UPI00041A8220|nr:polysaccharide biosynthesis C-terminal domain-containing protein [Butyrivibrio sp. NC3005]